jgi:hypothetical protein
MRAFVLLGAMVLAVLALAVKLTPRRAHHHPAPVVEEDDARTSEPAAPPVEFAASRPAPAPVLPSTPAHIFGRVVAPPGETIDFDELEVTADDGRRTISANVFGEGRFDLHVPPGQYTVEARFENWVGDAAGVAARSGGARELTIALGPTVALDGKLRMPAGATVSLRVSLAGRDDWDDGGVGFAGVFEATGLAPGRAYDLSFSGPGLRTTTLRSVTAPASDLIAQVDALAVLHGAIGFPSGGRCPIARVGLYAPDAVPAKDEDVDSDDEIEVDDACRFHLPVPDGASQMIVVAVGDGWHLEQPVSLAPTGDPDPVCLNPPCRANPLDGRARLRISLEGAPPGGGVHATLAPAAGETSDLYGCGGSGRVCTIDALDPGQRLTVNVGSADCAARSQTIVLAAGDNLVAVPCEAPPNGGVISEKFSDP